MRSIQADLVNGKLIRRGEVQQIIEAARRPDGPRTILVSASAGAGKSCVLAQAVDALESPELPVATIRLDRYGDADSPRAVGAAMELPRSPVVILAGVAAGRACVLVIDQLDAASQASGRYPLLWDLFERLREEAAQYPNMRLIVACREFDLDHDHRIQRFKQQQNVLRIVVQPLTIAEVDAALSDAGISFASLTDRQKEILRTPLHLFLFLVGGREAPDARAFANVGDLYARYWDRKCRSVSTRTPNDASWISAVEAIVTRMSDNRTLDVAEQALDEWRSVREAMLTENVLVKDGRRLRFFHESFFDYAFARLRCNRSNRPVSDLLHADEQHLFRRSQVRQILAYLRDFERADYLAELERLLSGPKVRFHIKRLALAWLGGLPDPTSSEWELLERASADVDVRRHLFGSIHGRLPWLDLLHRMRRLEEWLDDADESLVDRGFRLLSANPVQQQRSEVVAQLIAPRRKRSKAWADAVQSFIRSGEVYQSEPIQRLLLDCIDEGAFDGDDLPNRDSLWEVLGQAATHSPTVALEAIVRWLDRRMERLEAPFGRFRSRLPGESSAAEVVYGVAKAIPEEYAAAIAPRVHRLMTSNEIPASDGLRQDGIWRIRSDHEPYEIQEFLLDALGGSLESLAKTRSPELEVHLRPLIEEAWETGAILALRAWGANPGAYGCVCILFLIADPRRLLLGYHHCLGPGCPEAILARRAIVACLPHVGREGRPRLETAVADAIVPIDFPLTAKRTERLLLEAVGSDRLSAGGRVRLDELREELPKLDAAIPEGFSGGLAETVSPIPAARLEKLTDDEWIAAMREYSCEERSGRCKHFTYDHDATGCTVELSRDLQQCASRDCHRFAALATKMDGAIRPAYFEAVLEGIIQTGGRPVTDRTPADDAPESTPTGLVVKVIHRLDALPNRPCGRAIVRALGKLARRKDLDPKCLDLLAFYGREDADPEKDGLIMGDGDPGDLAFHNGYNSCRGAAAIAVADMIGFDPARWPALRAAVECMVDDPTDAVRTCVAAALCSLLRTDRDAAVELFVRTCTGRPTVFGSPRAVHFVRYAVTTHYPRLRQLVLEASRSGLASAATTAAKHVALAALYDSSAEADAQRLLEGSNAMRLGLAQVYADNVADADAEVGRLCQERLATLFHDSSSEVRVAAGDCFRHLNSENLRRLEPLFLPYIDSPAFPCPHDDLFRNLDTTPGLSPVVAIRLAERFLEIANTAAADITNANFLDARFVSKLVIGLYVQSNDGAVQRQCLDFIDQMERLALYGIRDQLELHDR